MSETETETSDELRNAVLAHAMLNRVTESIPMRDKIKRLLMQHEMPISQQSVVALLAMAAEGVQVLLREDGFDTKDFESIAGLVFIVVQGELRARDEADASDKAAP